MNNEEIIFTDRFSGQPVTGTLRRTLANGNLIVRTMHKSARGGLWAATDRVVKPSQVLR